MPQVFPSRFMFSPPRIPVRGNHVIMRFILPIDDDQFTFPEFLGGLPLAWFVLGELLAGENTVFHKQGVNVLVPPKVLAKSDWLLRQKTTVYICYNMLLYVSAPVLEIVEI